MDEKLAHSYGVRKWRIHALNPCANLSIGMRAPILNKEIL